MNKNMKTKNLHIALLVLFAFASPVFACGAPQPIYGRAVTGFGFPVYGARLELRDLGSVEMIQTARTNPFGWYSFEPVLPCSVYEVRITHKWFGFLPSSAWIEPRDFPNTPAGVRVDFAAVR